MGPAAFFSSGESSWWSILDEILFAVLTRSVLSLLFVWIGLTLQSAGEQRLELSHGPRCSQAADGPGDQSFVISVLSTSEIHGMKAAIEMPTAFLPSNTWQPNSESDDAATAPRAARYASGTRWSVGPSG